jgi:hypothetical protein
MPDLTHRTEQALLGALITDPGRTAAVGRLAPADFADQRHQAIFAALTGTAPSPSGPLGRVRSWLARLPLRRQIRDLRAYMDTLPGLCPDPDHAADYATMLSQARQRRDQAFHAEKTLQAEQGAPIGATGYDGAAGQLQASEAWLGQAARQAAVQTARGRRTAPAAGHGGIPRAVERLAQAVAVPREPVRQAQRGSAIASAAAPAPVSIAAAAVAEPAAGVAAEAAAAHMRRPVRQGTSVTADSNGTLNVEDLQDLVLAGLLKHPGDTAAVTEWLPAEVFSADSRQWLYQTIRDRTAAGHHVDPLIIAWQAATDGRGDLPAEVLRLGGMPAGPGTAVVLGRALLAEHVCTSLYGTDWPQSVHDPARDFGALPAGQPGHRQAEAPDHSLAEEPQHVPAAEQPEQRLVPGPVSGNPSQAPLLTFKDAKSAGGEPVLERPDGQHGGSQPVPRM